MSNFHQWNNIASHVVPIILALFLGSWSDKRGRKLPLLCGLVGKLIYSLMVVVNSTQCTGKHFVTALEGLINKVLDFQLPGHWSTSSTQRPFRVPWPERMLRSLPLPLPTSPMCQASRIARFGWRFWTPAIWAQCPSEWLWDRICSAMWSTSPTSLCSHSTHVFWLSP